MELFTMLLDLYFGIMGATFWAFIVSAITLGIFSNKRFIVYRLFMIWFVMMLGFFVIGMIIFMLGTWWDWHTSGFALAGLVAIFTVLSLFYYTIKQMITP